MPLKRAGNILSTIMIIVLSVLLVTVMVGKLVFHAEFKAVLTGSMEPELPVGSLLVVLPVEYDDISIGDDITFVRDESLTLVTHRVIEKNSEEQTITTQGIANNTKDAPTRYENVLGKVKISIPLIGYIVIWLSTTSGKIMALTIIIAIIILSTLLKYVFSDGQGDGNGSENEMMEENE